MDHGEILGRKNIWNFKGYYDQLLDLLVRSLFIE